MRSVLIDILLLFVPLITCNDVKSLGNDLGRAAVWHPTRQGKQVQGDYTTRTSFVSQVNEKMNDILPSKELVVRIKPAKTDSEGKSLFEYPSIQNSIKSSDKSFCFFNVYQDDKNSDATVIDKEKRLSIDSQSFANPQKQSIDDIMKTLQTTDILNDNVMDVIELELNSFSNDNDNIKMLQLLNDFIVSQDIDPKKVSFVAIDQPSVNAIAPSRRARDSTDRALTSSSTSSLYYEPEGTEFSIYYADTYLYITPDIFTGLMTSLFIVGVLLVGFGCLNEVQGASNFVMKPIPIGKEY